MTESTDLYQEPQPTSEPAGPATLDPSRWEDFEGFRETFLLNFTDLGDNAAFRTLGRVLYHLVLEAAHAMPAHPEGWLRLHVRAALADLRFLQGFLAFLAEERGEVEIPADEADLCRTAGEKAGSLGEIADAIEARLGDLTP